MPADARRGHVICIDGRGERLLCVYREQSVRSPREARALLQYGCPEGEPPSSALVSFVRAVRSGFGDTFVGARYTAGRVVLSSPNASAIVAAQQVADCHGLSHFDGRVTCAYLTESSPLTLFRCCSVLRDAGVRGLAWENEMGRVVAVAGEGHVDVRVLNVVTDASALRLLGFSKIQGESWQRRTTTHFVAPLCERLFGSLFANGGSLAVTVTCKPHLVLVPGAEELAASQFPGS